MTAAEIQTDLQTQVHAIAVLIAQSGNISLQEKADRIAQLAALLTSISEPLNAFATTMTAVSEGL